MLIFSFFLEVISLSNCIHVTSSDGVLHVY